MPPWEPTAGRDRVLCPLVPVDGLCPGDRGENIPRAGLGAGGVGIIGCYYPGKAETRKEDGYKCLFYSILVCFLLGSCSV